MWCSVTTKLTEDWHPHFWNHNLFIVYYHLVWGLDFCLSQRIYSQYPYPLSPYANILSFSFLLAFWVWLFVVEMKNLKNNAYSIQKLWMGEWRCQLYVHYMFWCNQKHWEYVVLRCKNKSISDIAVLLLKIKPLQNYVSRRQSVSGSIVLGFLLCDIVWHHVLFPKAEIWTLGYVTEDWSEFKFKNIGLDNNITRMVLTSYKENFATNFQPQIVTMLWSISNETYANIFSQLACWSVGWSLCCLMFWSPQMQDCFSGKI